ncbi:unnamed protein product [Arabis nemorensis]|uniref:Vacuolar sorting receptor thioredoxin-like domain-containing protein n=1 Tax=Arabis nemorensis TaxID=586526 RepID=A0A565C9E0_9BRAS|nr:unnamed protein product [Arabis nemorensis]
MEFVKDFKDAAQILEKGGFTQFRPHYITWYCPHAFTLSKQYFSEYVVKKNSSILSVLIRGTLSCETCRSSWCATQSHSGRNFEKVGGRRKSL